MTKRLFSAFIVIALMIMNTVLPVNAETQEDDIYLKYSSKSMYRGMTIKNKLIGASGKIKWSSSNRKIAVVSKKGTIKAKKIGRCIIKAKNKGKTYKCRIKVKRRAPNFDAEIVAVNRKHGRNYVKVRFRNYSNKSLKIMRKAKYDDFSRVTYKVKLDSSSKRIVRGKRSKTLTFYNYGKYDLYNHAGRAVPRIFALLESQLSYKFQFDGKTYPACTDWYEDEEEMDYYYESLYYNGRDSLETEAKYR